MRIKGLILKTIIMLAFISFAVIALNTLQIHLNANKYLNAQLEQHLDSIYQVNENAIIGDLLIGEQKHIKARLDEISQERGVGFSLVYNKNKFFVGNIKNSPLKKTYNLELGNGQKAELEVYSGNGFNQPWVFSGLWQSLVYEFLILGLGFLWVSRCFRKQLLNPLTEMVSHLKRDDIVTYIPKSAAVVEITELNNTLKNMHSEIQKKAEVEATSNAVKQLAHDIRSPLAALNRLLVNINQLPEKERVLFKNAIQRISDISNNLLTKHQPVSFISKRSLQPELISGLLRSILSEKRVQYDNRDIEFYLEIEKEANALFSMMLAAEFKQAVSNLIDNAAEAIDRDNKGKISLILKRRGDDQLDLIISDNGHGIPEELIEKILNGGVTTKKAGHGMGLSKAKKIIESFSGIFKIDSIVNKGTKIIIHLPLSKAASWFAESLLIKQDSNVIILDDDESIHHIWEEYFSEKTTPEDNIQLLNFYDAKSFIEFNQNEKNCSNNFCYLMDYNLLNNEWDGLKLIKHFNMANKSILVTNQYDDDDLRKKVINSSVKILPKDYAQYAPIDIISRNPDYVLLDDSASIGNLWKYAAEKAKKKLAVFDDIEKFKKYIESCSKDIIIYIDSNLNGLVKGEDIAKELSEVGYCNLYLETGYPKNDFKHVTWVKGILGKEPPFED